MPTLGYFIHIDFRPTWEIDNTKEVEIALLNSFLNENYIFMTINIQYSDGLFM